MRCRAAVFSILLLPYIFAPLDANAYRGENKLIEKLVEIEQDLAQNTKKALKAEERRDVELFRRELSRNESVSTDDDSIAEISREVDTLTRTSDR
jgi:hypothetical protein